MKVKICYTVNVSETDRRRMKAYYGEEGLATREDVQQWYWRYGQSMDDDMNDIRIEEETDKVGKVGK